MASYFLNNSSKKLSFKLILLSTDNTVLLGLSEDKPVLTSNLKEFKSILGAENANSISALKCENNSSAFLASVLTLTLPEAVKSEGKLKKP